MVQGSNVACKNRHNALQLVRTSGTDGILNGERIAYSTLMLVTRTTLPHLSVSLSMNWA